MNKNEIIESVNEGVVNEVCECTNSNGGIVTKVIIGTLVVAAVTGVALFIKKRKARKAQNEIVETESNEDYE